MLLVKFHGGLGNQMFQYAFYKMLKERFPNQQVKADLSRYEYQRFIEHNGFELDKVFDSIDLSIANRKEIFRCGGIWERKNDALSDVLLKRFSIFRFGLERKKKNSCVVLEQDYSEDKLKELSGGENYFFYGYWSNVESKKENLFHFSNNNIEKIHMEILEDIKKQQSVSIHVRRGDYVGTSFDCVGMEYYKKAIEIIQKKIKYPRFYLFLDDLEYLKKNFSYLKNSQIVCENREKNSYIDMYLMSQCKYNIICNSTFSFWAGVINSYENKIIIAPQKYLDGKEKNLHGIWLGV